MTLTFWGNVTSSVTGPMDWQYMASCNWSILTDCLSRTVSEMCVRVKKDVIGHVATGLSIWFPIGGF